MNKRELEKMISELSKKAEAERKKRECIVIGAFAIVFFLLYCFLEKTPESLGNAIGVLIGSLVLSAISCGINHAVFEHLSKKDEAAQREISELRKQLSAIKEKEYDEMIERYIKRNTKE